MIGAGVAFQTARASRRATTATARFVDVNPDYTLNSYGLLTTEQVSIRHQIKNGLSTPLGSEEYEPTYGSNVPFRVMEAINRANAHLLATDVIEALSNWMANRIVVQLHLLAVVELSEEDGYAVHIPYTSLATGDSDLYTFEVLR